MIRNLTARAEILIIILLACIPLFIRLPYRVNIFLSWEGAYRMSHGQLPFRDFGTPLGGMYWVIPAFFFKLFGSKMITLVWAQVFINIMAGLAFRSILISLNVDRGVRLVSVLLFCLSYSFINFWPWYNHSVIVYELLALACLFRYTRGGRRAMFWLTGAGILTVCSFLTKQDGGGMTFFIACAVLALYGLLEKKWQPLLVYVGSFGIALLLIILPFLHDGFGYWFNHGQAPHTARVSAFDIADEFFGQSPWIKFYLFFIVLLAVVRFRDVALWRKKGGDHPPVDKKGILITVLTLGILGEAAVFQVTSYTPPDNNIFFHSFAFACILSLLGPLLPMPIAKPRMLIIVTAGVLIWWSGTWWKYTQRMVSRVLPHNQVAVSPTGENIVNRQTYQISRDTVKDIPQDQWVECGLPSFHRITMPAPTADGITRLMDMDLVKRGRNGNLKVLNMSELTPLAEEVPFQLEKNSQLPLWYHLGVGMFNRQADTFETRIQQHYYDLVLFEYIPTLNNFYPFRVRDSLRHEYRLVDSFLAPRRGPETKGQIEVYVRPDSTVAPKQ
ncbi:MAG: hypothetical protein BGO55_06075 [Sphingobacteriales bacterium 50-39]|nr:hypothetical protein [Sphingobacteriales bacterium]OJW56147.1 MAG: hypothetical protein BGO55_06075 [Sphingobacteriales bacterium 50-39]